LEDLAEADAGRDLVPRQAEYLEEAAVDDLEPVLRIEQAQALRHVVERRVEPQVALPEGGFLALGLGDVAAHDDEAAVTRGAAGDAQPTAVGKLPFRHRGFAARTGQHAA